MKKKALSLALAALMLVSLTLTGCQKKDPPAAGDKVAVALFEMILKNDASSAVELFGYASEEEARKDMGLDGNIYEELADELADELAAQFTGMGLTASSEDVQGFVDAFMSMFKNVELTAKVKESNEKEGTSVVTCTISTFDANALNTAMSEALENIDPDAEFSTILSAIADVIADITPSGETADFDVDFELQKMEINGKEKEVWLPVDANEFGNLISTTAMGG